MSSRVLIELAKQSEHCKRNLAPRTGSIVSALAEYVVSNAADSDLADRVTQWPRNLLEDAVGLRLCAALHRIHLDSNNKSKTAALKSLFYRPTENLTQVQINHSVAEVLRDKDCVNSLIMSLDKPPQTNEVGRSGSYVAAFAFLREKFGVKKLRCLEIGTSGGLNLCMPHYHYRFALDSAENEKDAVEWGDPSSSVTIQPKMVGSMNVPNSMDFDIVSSVGCDLFPVDLRDEAEALRMKSFIWADHTWRHSLLDNAITTLYTHPPHIEKADAASWVREQLTRNRGEDGDGTCTVLMHSIVWQYLPEGTKAGITLAMQEAAALANSKNPIAWVALETNRGTMNHELCLRYWSGNAENDIGEPLVLAEAQAHGRWMKWIHAGDKEPPGS